MAAKQIDTHKIAENLINKYDQAFKALSNGNPSKFLSDKSKETKKT